MLNTFNFRRTTLLLAVLASLGLAACGGGNSDSGEVATASSNAITIPAEPVGLGFVEKADAPVGVPAYVDTGASNQRGNACLATLETNAGVRVLKGMLNIWAPRAAADGKVYVDAAAAAPASGNCPAVVASDWSGIPGDVTDGVVKDAEVHKANIAYVEAVTAARTSEQELAAYLDDRRGKSVSISNGMGPLRDAWLKGTGQTTTITGMPADAATTKYDDKGKNRGITTSAGNADLGKAVDLVFANSVDASTEPAKRYYKYARPYRWSNKVVVAPSLVPAKSSKPTEDGGFLSGHTAEAWRDALTDAWLVPQRYQEMITRAMVMGENRILAGMHSPLDVIGGRVQAVAQVAFNLNKEANASLRNEAYTQTQNYLMIKTGSKDFNELLAYARSASTSADPYADYATNKATYSRLSTIGFSPKGNTSLEAVVPKGAEILLETRLPYLSAEQRRVVLKTTALSSGYPVMDDEEGWGRLNLFAAADGYGAFNGDVSVTMDASLGGFNAADTWRNSIAGAGKLNKLGTGTLRLAGSNSYTGGTVVSAGILAADSVGALGKGDVFVKGGALECAAPGAVALSKAYTQTAGVLKLVMGGANQGVLNVAGTATLGGGSLSVAFSGFTPKAGDTLNVVTAGKLVGTFSNVTVAGFSKITTTYTSTGVQIRLDGV